MRDALLEVTPLMVHAVKWLRKKSDLQPPIALLDHTQVLRELMSVYKSSLMGDESEEDVRTGFKPVLDMMVDAAVEMCSAVSESFGQQVHKGKETWDKDVFLLNCLTHLVVSSSFDSWTLTR